MDVDVGGDSQMRKICDLAWYVAVSGDGDLLLRDSPAIEMAMVRRWDGEIVRSVHVAAVLEW